MELISATNPRTINGGILLDATFDTGEHGEYFALPNDISDYGRQIYVRSISGEFGAIRPYIAPPPTNDELLLSAKTEAYAGIEETDLVLIRCQKNGVQWPTAWRDYYLALLAIYRLEIWPDGGVTMPQRPEYPEGT